MGNRLKNVLITFCAAYLLVAGLIWSLWLNISGYGNSEGGLKTEVCDVPNWLGNLIHDISPIFFYKTFWFPSLQSLKTWGDCDINALYISIEYFIFAPFVIPAIILTAIYIIDGDI